MTPNLTRHTNKTIFVSLPTLFDDGLCRAFMLMGVELTGLWLQSDELTKRLVPEDRRELASLSPVIFVPFAHIAGVLVATVAPSLPATDSAPQVREPPSEPKAKKKSRT